MRFEKTVLLLVAVVALGGCASMSKNECLTADWRLIGFEDGASGSSPTSIAERRKACANHGITPDREAYLRGYEEGIAVFCSHDRGLSAGKRGAEANGLCSEDSDYRTGYLDGLASFCTYEVGYSEGASGRRYGRVCPPETEAEFLRGFDFGSQVYSIQAELRDMENRHLALRDEYSANEQRIDEIKQSVAYDEELDSTQRARLLEEMEQLNSRNTGIAVELTDLEHEMAAREYQLRDMGID